MTFCRYKDNKYSCKLYVYLRASDGNGLYTAVVRKGIGGYRTAYSGGKGSIELVLDKFGISHIYFPNVEKTALPIYFRAIRNSDISEVNYRLHRLYIVL